MREDKHTGFKKDANLCDLLNFIQNLTEEKMKTRSMFANVEQLSNTKHFARDSNYFVFMNEKCETLREH